MGLTGRRVLAGMALLGVFLMWHTDAEDDIHTEVQQRLLEAELGSATTFHFAGWSRELLPDDSPTDLLLDNLKSSQTETRWQAAKQLAVRRDARAVEAVIRAMRDPAGTRRVCVMASVLGHLKDPRALSALTEAAFDPGNRDLRLCAIQSLGMIGDRRAVPALIEAIRTGNNPVSAANAIARMGDVRGVEPIIQAARDPQLRLWMVRALGELGSTAAVPWLSSLGNDPEAPVRQAITEALWKIGQLSAVDPVQALSGVLRQEASSTRRMWAAFRLGELRQPGAVHGLITALSDPVREVQGRVAAALIRIGKPVIPAIKQLIVQTEVRASVYAVAILGYTGGKDEITFLRSLTTSDEDNERVAAAHYSIDLIIGFTRPQDGFIEVTSL